MIKVIYLMFLTFTLFALSSTKHDNNDKVQDCSQKNYGVLKVSYGPGSVKHSIIATLNGQATLKEKISNVDITSDSLHLAPGNYVVNISSLNNSNQAIDQQSFNLRINQCEDTQKTVSF